MRRTLGAILCLIGFWPVARAADRPAPPALAERGVTFYVPFEDSADPVYAAGERRFIEKVDLVFTEGKIGRALDVRADEQPRRVRTQLIYGLLGNLYGDQGTIAFWVRPHWRAGDPDLYAHDGGSGPHICGIEAEETHLFFSAWFRKLRFRWHLTRRDPGPGDFGFAAGCMTDEPIRTWQAEQWHHLLTTWHRDRGVRLYLDGRRLYDSWGTPHGPFLPGTPKALAVGAQAPRGGSHYWTLAPGLAFDELVLMGRPVSEPEVQALLAGRYLDLECRGPEPLGPAVQAERFRSWGLEPDTNRPVVQAADTAWVRWQALEVSEYDIDYNHRQYLADGHLDTCLVLSESGLDFAREVRLQLPRPQKANYVQVWGVPAADSHVRLPDKAVPLGARPSHAEVTRVGFEETLFQEVLPLWFGKASRLREVTAFHVMSGAQVPAVSAEAVPLGAAPSEALRAALEPLVLRYADRSEQAVVAAGRPAAATQPVQRQAGQAMTLASGPMSDDTGLAGVRLELAVGGLQAGQVFRLRLLHPEDFRRMYFDADVQVAGPADQVRRLVLDAFGPGLFYGKGRPVVVQVASSRAWALDAAASRLALVPATRSEVARAYANRELYALNDEFTGRQSKTRFQLRGETAETNVLKQWLERILHVDPEHAVARNLYHWCGFAPYPPPDFKALFWRPDCAGAPESAWVLREAIHQAARQIHFWMEHRQDPQTGYIMGDGNQFNDVTKLWTPYIYLPLLTDDRRMLDAIDRYLDCHLKHGLYKHGYCSYLTDMTHSVEEACYITGANAFLHDYRPMDIERLRDTAEHLPFWMAVTPQGRMHFKSNFFTATEMKTEGVYGWDRPDCQSATTPAGYLVLATGDAPTRERLLAWGDAWVAAADSHDPVKPDGLPPMGVQWSTGRMTWQWHGGLNLLFEHLLWCFHQTADRKYLKPIEALIRYSDSPEDKRFYTAQMYMGTVFVQWRLLTGETTYDAFFDKLYQDTRSRTDWQVCPVRGIALWESPPALHWVIHKDRQRLVEALKFVALSNARAYDASTHMDPDTDRVFPWGPYLLTVAALGGPALGERASMPYPLTLAIRWYGTGYDFASLVLDNTTDRLRFLAYSFADRPRQVAFKALRLKPGTYRLSVGPDRDGDDRPEAPQTRTVEIPAGLSRSPIVLDMPPRQVMVVAMDRP